jgi:hypothetical protein
MNDQADNAAKKELVSWIIQRRYEIQILLNDLYWFISEHRAQIASDTIRRRIAGLLIGGTFSMWRAAFLVDVAKREWIDILEAGEGFLKKVIETNAIGFGDEYRSEQRTWVVGYYLNNARFRGVFAIKEIERQISARTM